MNKRLRFFDKDTINWLDDKNFTPFYKSLIEIKNENPPLWNGKYGGDYKSIPTTSGNVYCFSREKMGNKVIVIVNMSGRNQLVKIESLSGKFTNAFTGKNKTLKGSKEISLQPWEYLVLTE
jgi:glycosidase